MLYPPKQKVIYPSVDDPEESVKKFNAIAKSLHVVFVLYADFKAFLVAIKNKESSSNIKVRQLHKPSGFACVRVSQVPELFNDEIFTSTGEDCMKVFSEHLKDEDHYCHFSFVSQKPMKTLTPKQQIAHTKVTSCAQCIDVFTA